MVDDHFLNLQPGTVVNGRYEIIKCLGTGSMGMVYACRHRELAGHAVAMKVLFSEVARDEVAAQRFRNEIVASYGVSHPNVVRAYEYFRDGSLIAFTMEYISGGDLAERISSDESIEIDTIITMLTQMCSGVQAIHDAGIIHRDLKPENILLTEQGDVKITDFGIARMGTGPKLTEHGGVVGTIDYVSPEYLEQGQVDTRSDIYALGVLGYEMITGEAPFKGKSVIETMTMRLTTDPVPPTELREDCPPALADIIGKAMARDPEKRYQTAFAMFEDLTAIASEPMSAYSLSSSSALQTFAPAENSPSAVLAQAGLGSRASDLGPDPVNFNPDTSEAVDVRSDTASLRALSALEEELPVDDIYDSGLYESQRMESVLKPGSGEGASKKGTSNDLSGSRISVSSARLSSERVQQLNAGLSNSSGGGLKALLTLFLVILVGFGVGILLVRAYFPEYLGLDATSSSPNYIDENPPSIL
ncbi:hypothetical protein BVY02_00485 [bacterium J17]|nr:hypothetical protein BVY02_00485 [bacterium J17]